MAERKDGIKSFFMKQSPKKAPDAKAAVPPSPLRGKSKGVGVEEAKSVKEEAKAEVKEETKPSVKEEAKGVKEEAKPDVKEAKPSVTPTTRQTRSTAKHEAQHENEAPNDGREVKDPPADPVDAVPKSEVEEVIDVDADAEPSQSQSSQTGGKRKRVEEKRGGRQTKVTRPAPKEEEGQKSITAFFKSPRK